MNKYITFGILVLFILFMTYVVDFASNYENTLDSVNPIEELPGEGSPTSGSVISLITTFWKIATFQVEGLPALFTVLIFYPCNLIVLYMIIDILKDLVPFT